MLEDNILKKDIVTEKEWFDSDGKIFYFSEGEDRMMQVGKKYKIMGYELEGGNHILAGNRLSLELEGAERNQCICLHR